MTDEIVLGTVRKTPIGEIADRAARAIAVRGEPLAVTFWPCGRLCLEPVEDAAEDDIVGVYRGDRAFTLARAIDSDLRFAVKGGA